MRRLCSIVVIGSITLASYPVTTRSQDPVRTLSPDTAAADVRGWSPTLLAQLPLTSAADRLQSFIRAAGPHASVAGFGSIELDVEARTVLVYWKAGEELPPALEDLVQEVMREGVNVVVETAPYSRGDLTAEAMRLLDEAPASSVTEVSLLSKASGLSVELNVDMDARSAHASLKSMKSRLEKRRSAAFGLSGEADVKLTSGRARRGLSRFDDSPPWKGGAELSAGCSTGFAVGSWFGRYMLSAGHCFWWVDGVQVHDGAGHLMGVTEGAREARRAYRDSTLIRLNSGNIGRIYDGGVGRGEFTKPVKGPVNSYVNQYLCTSGALSGARCDIKVESTTVYIYDSFGNKFGPVVKARQIQGSNAAGAGDSGGPVFALNAQSNVLAAGIINAGDPDGAPAACTGVIWDSRYGFRECSSVIYYTPIWTLLHGHGVWLETN